jgi:hypothetical protein
MNKNNKLTNITICPACKGSGKKTNGSCGICHGHKTFITTIDQTKKAKKEVKLKCTTKINKALIELQIDLNNIEKNKKKNKVNKKM